MNAGTRHAISSYLAHRTNEYQGTTRGVAKFSIGRPLSYREVEMRRQLAAIVFGAIVAVAVIYAVFDQRVSVRNLFANAPSTQQSN
jgi:hypothetical protein